MVAGIVYYRRDGDSLVGKWSHEDTGGMLADEVVRHVSPGATEGTWPVEICDPGGNLMFEGDLSSAKLGESLKFEWIGTFSVNGEAGRFEGIGIALSDELIIGTFEQVAVSESTI